MEFFVPMTSLLKFLSATTSVALTRLDITLYAHCLPYLLSYHQIYLLNSSNVNTFYYEHTHTRAHTCTHTHAPFLL